MAFARRTALSLAFAAVAGLGIWSAAAPASAETVLKRGIGSTIGTLDPQVNFLAYEAWIQDDMYEGLVTPGADGEPIPGAAEKWDISDDGLTYTFHLRDGLKWSDGSPLAAQAFVDSVARTLDPATASEKNYIFSSTISIAGAADYMSADNKGPRDPKTLGISAPDDKTVVIKLDKPAPYMLYLMNSFYVAPLHKPSLEAHGKDFVKPEFIVSNGAYHMSESVPQSHVTLVKNPNYWNAANVKIDKVTYVITEDDSTAVKLFKAGDQDITYDIPSDQIDPLKKEFGDQVHVTNSTETVYFSFNLKKPPFDNAKVRAALSMAIDRDTLVNKVVKGGYVVSCGYVIPIPTYDAPKVPECGMDKAARVAKAQELFKAGMADGQAQPEDRIHRQRLLEEDRRDGCCDVEADPRRRCQGECAGPRCLAGRVHRRYLGRVRRRSGRRLRRAGDFPLLHGSARRGRLQLGEPGILGPAGQGDVGHRPGRALQGPRPGGEGVARLLPHRADRGGAEPLACAFRRQRLDR